MSRFFSIVVFVVLLASAATAQTVNEGNLTRVKSAGFSDDQIIAAINKAKSVDIDTSEAGLSSLREKGFSAEVIAAILDREGQRGNKRAPKENNRPTANGGESTNPPAPNSPNESITNSNATVSNVSANSNAGYPTEYGVYFETKEGWVAVQPAGVVPTMKNANGLLGMVPFAGNANKQVFAGRTAPTKIGTNQIRFCVVSYALSAREIKVLVLDQKDDRREIEVSRASLRSMGMRIGHGKGKSLDTEARQVAEGIAVFTITLPDGEYVIDYDRAPRHDFSVFSGGQQIASN